MIRRQKKEKNKKQRGLKESLYEVQKDVRRIIPMILVVLSLSPSIFPSKKKQTELEYSTKKGTQQVLKEEAKKLVMKREIHDKKKMPHLKTEEGEVLFHHMHSHHMSSSSSYNDHADDGMKVDVDILSESFNKSTSFNKIFFSERSLKEGEGSVDCSAKNITNNLI